MRTEIIVEFLEENLDKVEYASPIFFSGNFYFTVTISVCSIKPAIEMTGHHWK